MDFGRRIRLRKELSNYAKLNASAGKYEVAHIYEDRAQLELLGLKPDIQGSDIEGKKFKLSDYAGKVVLLDFFGDWCRYCRRMYPLERSLVEEYDGRPFVLLGVCSDSGHVLRKLIEHGEVTWGAAGRTAASMARSLKHGRVLAGLACFLWTITESSVENSRAHRMMKRR